VRSEQEDGPEVVSNDRFQRVIEGEVNAPSGPTRARFQEWLDEIDDELVGGALLVSAAVPRVTRAWLAADRAVIADTTALSADVCERVRRVEDQGFVLLAREAPVAGDLRRLVAILRLVTSVERSAALLKHVAETLERVDPEQLAAGVRTQVDELGRRAGEVFRRGVDAWRSRDGLAVHELDVADEAVDTLSVGLLQQADAVESPAEAMALAQLSRYWERIADHGVSFAQHSTFAVTGERVEVGP
jgi:phosphate transport system protein